MDWTKIKAIFEPKEEEKKYDWGSLKPKFEPETSKNDWESLKVKFEPEDDVTTPAPVTTPIKTPLGIGAQAKGGAILPEPEQEPFDWVESQRYHPEKISGIGKGISVLGSAITKLPKQIKAAALSVSQGAKGASVANKDWADEYIASAQKDQEVFVDEMISKYGDISVLPGIKISDIAQMPQSMAFSAASMGAGLAVGVPTALIPLPGSRILAWGLGTVASGKAAYEMSAYQIMQTYLDVKNEEKMASTGQELTLKEENNLKQGFNNLAKQYALWEAVPEAISNLSFVGVLTAPLTKMVGKTIAGRIVNKVAAIYGGELLTETITEIGQKGVMGKVGLPGGGEVDWTSPTEWVEAFKAVAPQTFLLTTIMGGTGTLVINTNKVVKSLNKEVKDSVVKEELINKIEDKESLLSVVKEEVKEPQPTPAIPAELAGLAEEARKYGISEKDIITEKNELIKIDEENRKSGFVKGTPVSEETAFKQAINGLIEDKKSKIKTTETTDILTKERQNEVKKSTSFEDTFSKSKVPEVVYHGSQSEKIIEFEKRESSGVGIGAVAKVEGDAGFWFTSNKSEAKGIGNVIQAKLNMKNPLILEGDIYFNTQGTARLDAISEMEGEGKDSIIFTEPTTKQKWYFVPNKEQIVSSDFYAQATAGKTGAVIPTTEKPAVVEAVAEKATAVPVTGKGKISKIAGSIEAKSIEQGLTKGYGHLAEYTPIVIKEQAQKASDLINTNIDEARRVIRGEKPLPEGLKGTALITAMEEHIKKTADGEMASELASSPLVSGTSAAAQELRLAAERDPESPVKAIQDINKLLEESAKKRQAGQNINKAKNNIFSNIKNEIKKANSSQSWEQFILSIRCS